MDKKLLSHFFNEERGQVLVLSAILILVILGITAFTTDIGWLQSNKRHLQNTADAAALAGARDLADGKEAASVNASVNKYVLENGVDVNEVTAINIVGDKRVAVELQGSRGLFFARVLGHSSANVGARATAETGPVGGMKGLFPVGIAKDTFINYENNGNNIIQFGTAPGNWGWVNLDYPYTGKSVKWQDQVNYINNGFDKMIYYNQIIHSDTGADIQSNGHIDSWSVKVKYYIDNKVPLYIPIIDNWDINGNKALTIKGFAAIIITGQDVSNPANYSMTAKINKDASFYPGGVMNPDPTAPNIGVKTIGLVE